MEQSVPSSQLISEMQNGFKPYQNKGKFQSRMDDIKQELIRIDAMQGVVTEPQKEQLMDNYKSLALSCAKALIISEVGRQNQEQSVNQNMSMSM